MHHSTIAGYLGLRPVKFNSSMRLQALNPILSQAEFDHMSGHGGRQVGVVVHASEVWPWQACNTCLSKYYWQVPCANSCAGHLHTVCHPVPHLHCKQRLPLPATSCSSLAPRSSTQPGLLQHSGTGHSAARAPPHATRRWPRQGSSAASLSVLLLLLVVPPCMAAPPPPSAAPPMLLLPPQRCLCSGYLLLQLLQL
jgi:hypothetical protein